MKTISIVVPCYNEEENVQAMADALRETFKKDLPAYRYEILFIDNDSKDRTREIIRKLCAEDKGIKGIFNAKILDSSIHRTMLCSRQQEMPQY